MKANEMNEIKYLVDDDRLSADAFLVLVNRVWPGEYLKARVEVSLRRTLNITAWNNSNLVGCVRILSDGYFFTTITEILVDPVYQKKGIGSELMKLAWDNSPSSMSFGVQAGNEEFFEKLGFEKGLNSFQKTKKRNVN